MAAAYVAAPGRFKCAQVTAAIAKDRLFLMPWRDHGLLVTQRPVELDSATIARTALYCPDLQEGNDLEGVLRGNVRR